MSTLKVNAINSVAASSGGIAINSAGNVTGLGLDLITPSSIAYSGGTASASGGAVSFSGVSTVSLNGVWTSAYANYVVVFRTLGSTSLDAGFRLRASGADTSTSYIFGRTYVGSQTSVAFASTNNTTLTYYPIGDCDATNFLSSTIHVYGPQLAERTGYSYVGSGSTHQVGSGAQTATTQYDGLTFLTTTGTLTGTVRVYGYKN